VDIKHANVTEQPMLLI